MLWFWWFRHSDVFNVTSSENDIFVDFFFRWHRSVCVSILCTIGFNCREIKVTKQLPLSAAPYSTNPPKRVASGPLDLPLANAIVDLSVSTEDNIPSYRICALEIKLILLPMYGVPPPALMFAEKRSRFGTNQQPLNHKPPMQPTTDTITKHLRAL